MRLARMGVRGKGQQSLAPPQHTVTPALRAELGHHLNLPAAKAPDPIRRKGKRYAVDRGLFCGSPRSA